MEEKAVIAILLMIGIPVIWLVAFTYLAIQRTTKPN